MASNTVMQAFGLKTNKFQQQHHNKDLISLDFARQVSTSSIPEEEDKQLTEILRMCLRICSECLQANLEELKEILLRRYTWLTDSSCCVVEKLRSTIEHYYSKALREKERIILVSQALEKCPSGEDIVVKSTGNDETAAVADDLLLEVFPRRVALQLLHNQHTEPEYFDDVTIFFSDIVGFTSLCTHCTPLEVMQLLNELYTHFDDVISQYDAYKIETIGDAYMVASGVPVRNERRHAPEICTMALHILNQTKHFSPRCSAREKLQIRIGIHRGPCAAGVVGRLMPRYCLYGDTVNTASRMETTGEANRIHISQTTKDALDESNDNFVVKFRGVVELKGKGEQKTYWLESRDSRTPQSF